MVANDPMTGQMNDDPRRLRSLLDRARDLAREHAVPSVMLGLTARTGDLNFPEFVAFLQSALRVEDAIFRMTRERAVVHLADLELEKAREVAQEQLEELEKLFGREAGRPGSDARPLHVSSFCTASAGRSRSSSTPASGSGST